MEVVNNTKENKDSDRQKDDDVFGQDEILLKDKKDDVIDPFNMNGISKGIEDTIHIDEFKSLEKEVRIAMIGNVDSGKVYNLNISLFT